MAGPITQRSLVRGHALVRWVHSSNHLIMFALSSNGRSAHRKQNYLINDSNFNSRCEPPPPPPPMCCADLLSYEIYLVIYERMLVSPRHFSVKSPRVSIQPPDTSIHFSIQINLVGNHNKHKKNFCQILFVAASAVFNIFLIEKKNQSGKVLRCAIQIYLQNVIIVKSVKSSAGNRKRPSSIKVGK